MTPTAEALTLKALHLAHRYHWKHCSDYAILHSIRIVIIGHPTFILRLQTLVIRKITRTTLQILLGATRPNLGLSI